MGRNTKYPYQQWTDGEWHDVDLATYGKTVSSFRSILHQYAKANRYHLRTSLLSNGMLSIRFERI